MKTTRYLELDCVELANDSLQLLVTQSAGPRILALCLRGRESALAELPELTIDLPNLPPWTFYGGHRLWQAPEVAAVTYLPDDRPVVIESIDNGLRITQAVEPKTGLRKSLQIQLPDQSAAVVVDHQFSNQGSTPVTLAPWAITQLKPGGLAILPQYAGLTDPAGVQANRSLVFWPYTDINSPHVQWGNRFVRIRAQFQTGAFKLGFPNPNGWLAYLWQDTLFVKKAPYEPAADYYERGSSSQFYCNDKFVELESLGPISKLEPNQSITHQETWHLYADVAFPVSEDDIQEMVQTLGLE